jgi:SAM-dependent methyltransferase
MMDNTSSQDENYYILGDSNAEMVHLIITDRHFNRSMGGLLPEQPDSVISSIHDVLDVGCGPGGWALELAQAYPHMQVTGFDLSAGMIDYARVQAHASMLDNAHFFVANAMKPFEFPDDSFDLVNVRHLEGVLPVAAWSEMLKEMLRVTREGGIIRLTDCEWGVSNSFANEKLLELTIHAMQATGLSHSPDGRNYNITHLLSHFLRDVGCVNVQERPSILDFSAGEQEYQGGTRILTLAYELMEPFLLGTQVSARPELDQLRRQQSLELLEDSFRGIIYTLTAWGTKPSVRS